MAIIFTVGHSTHPLQEFLDMLTDNGVEQLVDVRKLPGSRRFPHFDQDALRESLAGVGIGYDWVEPLTGRRKVSTTVPFEVNAFWNNRSFHNYADHALSEEFVSAVEKLVDAPAPPSCCAPRPCGGAATGASSPITSWPGAWRSPTSWVRVRPRQPP